MIPVIDPISPSISAIDAENDVFLSLNIVPLQMPIIPGGTADMTALSVITLPRMLSRSTTPAGNIVCEECLAVSVAVVLRRKSKTIHGRHMRLKNDEIVLL
ncbi:hypothetical protein EYB53_023975 [Candidatus Chloroploca sp. M-50]|uniref:Uncharacterized protein n=1 Tax=Candidatus Chloroploca mongolica TaxID=2528176 RepID=A0ABS4DH72_9CHLR|nr:hypothetical protein [Candidatus Chloroploca mongolica]MBP1468790.1 hypothetical protein [Candidatus Chloroploca mongolica]